MDNDLYKADCFGDPKLYNKPIKEIEVIKYLLFFFNFHKKYISGKMETCSCLSQS